MSNERQKTRVEKGAWICLYGGLLAVVLGVVFQRQGPEVADLAGIFLVVGGLVAATGAGLIWLRSVMK
ncbi:hypothetical protein ACLBKS_03830 [Hylemonella sp. W303a]|uniref:hypothetical protein n=1 Tax=Hylemonella sp. W303a TaxID=3389873 RepID=UPI00396B1D0E